MEFQGGQGKFLKNKKSGIQILKGSLGTGKTTVSIYKAVDLEKNYCIYDKDKVLVVSLNRDEVAKAKDIYGKANLEMENSFYSLFSLKDKNQVEFVTIKSLIDSYVKSYMRENKLKLTYAEEIKKISLLTKVLNDFSKDNKLSKFIKNVPMEYLLEEIEWIKASAFNEKEYMSIARTGRGKSIRKDSKTRKIVYKLKDSYSYELHRKGFMDKYDEGLFAINYSKKFSIKYTHIILDNCESLTRSEMILMNGLKEKRYGSFIIIINNIHGERKNNWLTKGRKINDVVGETRGRNFVFKNKFESLKKKDVVFIDKYKYIDINKGKVLNFEIDNGSSKREVIITEKEEKLVLGKDIVNIPVYSDIAAGEPILINDIEQGVFNFPREFIGNNENLFMLHVRGDSMIEKDINNGDFVIIKSQNSAYHNEIVAVDIEGSATLKTLNLNAKEPLLMPANEKYEPIKLKGKESNILGVVLGVLKNQ